MRQHADIIVRVAYLSDLHLEERKDPSPLGVPAGIFPVYGSVSLPKQIDADVLVIAGDTHPDSQVRADVLARVKRELGIPVIHVNGNHDYYSGEFPSDTGEIVTIEDVRFAVATLWTYLDEVTKHEADRFPDFIKIAGAHVGRWNDLHFTQLTFLEQAKADVIVTHHAPFPGSIHEDFHGDVLNPFFVNEIDPERFPRTRLWIHSHVHFPFDYVVRGIRVVCNPLGYPTTRRRGRFGLKIVEI